MKNLLSKIEEGELENLIKNYLLRQVKEWVQLKENFIIETGMKNNAYFEHLLINFIPYISTSYQNYAIGLLNELEIRRALEKSARIFLKEKIPELDNYIKVKRAAKVFMIYLSTVFMAHGIREELERVFIEAIKFSKKKSVLPSEIFEEDKLYEEFLRESENMGSFRKKLETLFGALNPKRIIKILNYPPKSSEKYTAVIASQSPFAKKINEEINCANLKSAETIWKQIYSWPNAINKRVTDIFYPRLNS